MVLRRSIHAASDHSNVIGAGEVNIEKEADEVPIIEMTDTIVDPRAMMVCRSSLGEFGPTGKKMGSPIRRTHLEWVS